MNETSGWAVIISDRILVKTVSETRRAAIVNYLMVNHGINVRNDWTDERIEMWWDHTNKVHANVTPPGYRQRIECRQVRIAAIADKSGD